MFTFIFERIFKRVLKSLASSLSVLGLEATCPRQPGPWPWPRTVQSLWPWPRKLCPRRHLWYCTLNLAASI